MLLTSCTAMTIGWKKANFPGKDLGAVLLSKDPEQ